MHLSSLSSSFKQLHDLEKFYNFCKIIEQTIQSEIPMPLDKTVLKRFEKCKLEDGQSLKIAQWFLQHREKIESINTLSLSNQKLSSVSDEFLKIYCKNLQTLYLTSNKLNNFPKEITRLTNLTYLDLSHNCLNTLPETIGNLTLLSCLKLINNNLSTLPSSFFKLNSLKVLNIVRNQFSYIPQVICSLSNLEELYLDKNPLIGIPSDFCKLPKLEQLTCPRVRLPSPICTPKISDVSYQIYKFYLKTLEPFFDFKEINIPNSEEIIDPGKICQEDLKMWSPKENSVIKTMTPLSRFILIHKGSIWAKAVHLPIIENKNFSKTVGKCVGRGCTGKNSVNEVNSPLSHKQKRVYKIITDLENVEVNYDEFRVCLIAGNKGVGPCCYGIGFYKGEIYIEMDKIAGSPISALCDYSYQLFEKIKLLNEQCISYGDCHSDNILKNNKNEIFLIDYEFSRIHPTIAESIRSTFEDANIQETFALLSHSTEEPDLKLAEWFYTHCPELEKK